jgi:hypothetical protein
MLLETPHKSHQSWPESARWNSSVAFISSLKTRPCCHMLQARQPARAVTSATGLHADACPLPILITSYFLQSNNTSSQSGRLSSGWKLAPSFPLQLILLEIDSICCMQHLSHHMFLDFRASMSASWRFLPIYWDTTIPQSISWSKDRPRAGVRTHGVGGRERLEALLSRILSLPFPLTSLNYYRIWILWSLEWWLILQVHISFCPQNERRAYWWSPGSFILFCVHTHVAKKFHLISADQLDFRWLILQVLASSWNNMFPRRTVFCSFWSTSFYEGFR